MIFHSESDDFCDWQAPMSSAPDAADRQKALDFGAQEFVHLDNGTLEDVGGVDLVVDVIGLTRPIRSRTRKPCPFLFDLIEHEGLVLGGSNAINIVGAGATCARPRSGQDHRDHPRGWRAALSIQAVQPGLPA
jgi:hypothetical protein